MNWHYGAIVSVLAVTLAASGPAAAEPSRRDDDLLRRLGELEKRVGALTDRAVAAERELAATRAMLGGMTGDEPPVSRRIDARDATRAPLLPDEGKLATSVRIMALRPNSSMLEIGRTGGLAANPDDSRPIDAGHGHAPGIELGFGYGVPGTRWSLGASASWLHGKASWDRSDNHTIDLGGTPVEADRSTGRSDLLRIRASGTADYHLIADRDTRLALGGGLGFGHIDSDKRFNILAGADVGALGSASTRYWGIGPEAGASLSHHFGKGFGLRGSGGMAMLIGKGTHQRELIEGATHITRKSEDVGRVVQVYSTELALTYDRLFDTWRWTGEVGVQAEMWQNLPQSRRSHVMWWEDEFNDSDAMTFWGPFARVKAAF